MRLLLVFVAISLLFASPLLFFGDRFDTALQGELAVSWLQDHGRWAGLVGIGLIVADLVLPIPATGIMAALGIIYGPLIGGIFAGVGSLTAGLIAYAGARLLGHRAAVFLVGEKDLARASRFFRRSGGYAVALSRPLPLLPEVIACLAGLAGMPARRFLAALACGSLPTGLVFAWLGAAGRDRPITAIALSVTLPLLLWLAARQLLDRQNR